MNNSANYAIFIDLENAGGKVHMLSTIIEKVKIRGNILLGKAYGYTDAFSPLKEMLLSNTFQVVPSIKFGHSQKNNLDIQLVIDALEVAYKNELIDCFCIVSGDSDYTPLVGKLKSMGKFVLGISRSEVASKVFINACNEFIFLESMAAPEKKQRKKEEDTGSVSELNDLIKTILKDAGGDCIYASELKNTLLRLRPNFNERSYGAAGFGKLLGNIEKQFGEIHVENDNFSLKVTLAEQPAQPVRTAISRENWVEVVGQRLQALKAEGFERVNPSVIKDALLEDYPDFEQRALGFRKFSDMIKALEKQGIVQVETDEQKAMLVRILRQGDR